MKIFNEYALKEFTFDFFIKDLDKSVYSEGLSLFQKTIIDQSYFLKENSEVKIISRIYNKENFETTIIVNFNKKEIEYSCSVCGGKVCAHIVASIFYFLENFKYNYVDKKIDLIELVKKKEPPERFKGYVITKERDIFPCIVANNDGIFSLKKYSKEGEFNKLDESTVEFIVNYQRQNPNNPLFFIMSKGKVLIPLIYVEEPLRIILNFERISDNDVKVFAKLEKNNLYTILKGFFKKYFIFRDGEIRSFYPGINLNLLDEILEGERVIDVENLNNVVFFENEFKKYKIYINSQIKGFNIIQTKPDIKVYLETEKNFLKVKPICVYENKEIELMQENRVVDDTIIFVNDYERSFYNELAKFKPFKTDSNYYFTKEDAINFIGKILYEKFPEVKIFGEEKLIKFKVLKPKSNKLHIKTFSFNEWFGIDGWLDFEELKISLYDIVKAIKKGKKFIQIKKDVYAPIPDKVIENINKLLSNEFIVYDKKDKKIKSLKPNIESFDKIIEELSLEVEHSKDLLQLKEKILDFKKIKKYKIPEPVNSILRNYQKEGVWWLLFLRDYSLNGILADEMGLGKTIQALTLLMFEKDNRPNLIIVPTSLIYNWENEIKKFSYNFKYLIYYGKNREKFLQDIKNYEIVITTYNIVRIDIEKLKTLEFNYIILDESQYIKNPTSIISRYLVKLKANHKLALTGTPLENNLNELWSQFNFLSPGLLGDLKEFLKKYSNKENLDKLKRKLRPLILRRKKEEVLDELPPKVEIYHYYEMNEEQKKFYDAVRIFYLERIFKQIASNGINKSYNLILEGLLRLRQICCHPILAKFEYENLKKIKSEKFENFKKLILNLVEKDRKVLVYSQFVEMLKIIRNWLKNQNIKFEYLDGSSQNRYEIVKRFQNDETIKVFLLSIKAGGVGLNLTSADNVILYDPWWNPAVEAQAIDRTHRIGQNNKVFVYKLIIKDSIEDRVLQLQKHKKELFDNLLEYDIGSIKNLTKEDLEFLFN